MGFETCWHFAAAQLFIDEKIPPGRQEANKGKNPSPRDLKKFFYSTHTTIKTVSYFYTGNNIFQSRHSRESGNPGLDAGSGLPRT
jgi:hypothetical protein